MLDKLSCVLGDYNPWFVVEAEGVGSVPAPLFAVGGQVSSGVMVNPLTQEACTFSKACFLFGGGAFLGAGLEGGLQFGPRRSKVGELQEEVGLSFEGGEAVGLGVDGSITPNGFGVGIKPQVGAGIFAGQTRCAVTINACYTLPK